VLAGAARERAGRIGLHNAAPFLVDAPPRGIDVKRLSLAMGRTCRLASFNDYRRHFGLPTYGSFEDLTRDRGTAAELKALYGDIDRLEWFVGLFAEGYDESAMMGELMTTMVANDAFTQALTNPLLARSVYNADTFGRPGMAIVRTTRTLAQVIARNTGLRDEEALRFETARV
jgi:prostaglandin-endoperoxide synthase 2